MAADGGFKTDAEELLVFQSAQGWCISYDARTFGPYADKFAAIRAALEAAALCESLGHFARVRESVLKTETRTLWSTRAVAGRC
jgi:hypothetical protein